MSVLSWVSAPIDAVYLVALHRAETALAGSLRRLLHERNDRMPHFTGVDWAKALGVYLWPSVVVTAAVVLPTIAPSGWAKSLSG